MIKKECKNFYLSVEGETEEWYFKHLQKLINEEKELPYSVSIEPKKMSIKKRIRGLSNPYSITAFHICDYESNEEMHIKHFKSILTELREAREKKPYIDYTLGYSNLTFELWIILHKRQSLATIPNRNNYIEIINRVYNENFENMQSYKVERNFKKILEKIELKDVIKAVGNAEKIRTKHEERNDPKEMYEGFEYYTQNPDMTIQKCVKIILKECGVIKN